MKKNIMFFAVYAIVTILMHGLAKITNLYHFSTPVYVVGFWLGFWSAWFLMED